jgi:hypothetical protein
LLCGAVHLNELEVPMDFIERWLGVSPDGGSGTFELALLLALVTPVVVAILERRRRRRSRR